MAVFGPATARLMLVMTIMVEPYRTGMNVRTGRIRVVFVLKITLENLEEVWLLGERCVAIALKLTVNVSQDTK